MNSYVFLRLLVSKTLNAGVQNELSIGLIILTIIEMPVLILILTSILGRPRRSKITGLFLGYLFSMFFVFVTFIYLIGRFQAHFF
jgi:hypothetical protein